MPKTADLLTIGAELKPPDLVKEKIDTFLASFTPEEATDGGRLRLFFDQKSGAYYITCHLSGSVLAHSCDTDASLDGDDEDEIYKLNREIQEDPSAFQLMEKDALEGRSFEDIVLEYDDSYRPKKPLKVY